MESSDGRPGALSTALAFDRGATRAPGAILARRFKDSSWPRRRRTAKMRDLDVVGAEPVETTGGALLPTEAAVVARFVGCARAEGSFEARFVRQGTHTLVVFEFDGFHLGDGTVDGVWVASVDDSGDVYFHGRPDYSEPERPAADGATGGRRRRSRGAPARLDVHSTERRAEAVLPRPRRAVARRRRPAGSQPILRWIGRVDGAGAFLRARAPRRTRAARRLTRAERRFVRRARAERALTPAAGRHAAGRVAGRHAAAAVRASASPPPARAPPRHVAASTCREARWNGVLVMPSNAMSSRSQSRRRPARRRCRCGSAP